MKTQASWEVELTKKYASLAIGVEMYQVVSMKPLQAVIVVVSDNQFFVLLVVDDGMWATDLSGGDFFLGGGAQGRILLCMHWTFKK